MHTYGMPVQQKKGLVMTEKFFAGLRETSRGAVDCNQHGVTVFGWQAEELLCSQALPYRLCQLDIATVMISVEAKVLSSKSILCADFQISQLGLCLGGE